jgi:hypothetical protein
MVERIAGNRDLLRPARSADAVAELRSDDHHPKDHLLRRINVFVRPVLGGVRGQLRDLFLKAIHEAAEST